MRTRSVAEASATVAILAAAGISLHVRGGIEARWVATAVVLLALVVRHMATVSGPLPVPGLACSLLTIVPLLSAFRPASSEWGIMAAGAAALAASPAFAEAGPTTRATLGERALTLIGVSAAASGVGLATTGPARAITLASMALAVAPSTIAGTSASLASRATAAFLIAGAGIRSVEGLATPAFLILGVAGLYVLIRATEPPLQQTLTKAALGTLVVASVVYHAIMVEFGAFTVPCWDEWGLVPLVVGSENGSLSWADLFAPHAQHRPVTSRILLVALARLTRWDLRAEYLLVIASTVGLFAVLAGALWRVMGRKATPGFLDLLSILALVVFSPAAHEVHNFSFAVHIVLSAIAAAAALVQVSEAPSSWRANAAAAALCWIATYSVGNGTIAFLLCLLIVQASQSAPWRPNRFVAFWLANMVLMALLYFPGLPPSAVPPPSLGTGCRFVAMYLGSALGYLPQLVPLAGAFGFQLLLGVVLVASSVVLPVLARLDLRARSEDRLALAFAALALGSAVVTAYGRAEPDSPTLGAASRFAVFASFLPYGLIFGVAGRLPSILSSSRRARAALAVHLAFVAGSVVGYAQGVAIYSASHETNRVFATPFNASPELPYAEKWLYPGPRPDLDRMRHLDADLAKHRLGPYRFSVVTPAPLPAPPDGGEAVAPDEHAFIGRIESIEVFESSSARYLDVSGWAAVPGRDATPFVLLDVDHGARRRVVATGIPVTGPMPFRLPSPDIPLFSGWGVLWEIDLAKGAHAIRSYAFKRGQNHVVELAGVRTFDWPG